MSSYTISEHLELEPHILFFRVEPTDLQVTLREILDSLCDLSWISTFDAAGVREGYLTRANATVKHLTEKVFAGENDAITSDSGEYVVSELSRKTIVDVLRHTNIPLGEIFKAKKSGNPGFDFYTVSPQKEIYFGEAKYRSKRNAFSGALEQVNRFILKERRDTSDFIEIRDFCCETSKKNFAAGTKGVAACFSSKRTSTEKLVQGIKKDSNYAEFRTHRASICVAVDLWPAE